LRAFAKGSDLQASRRAFLLRGDFQAAFFKLEREAN
jgi:hypothetical protein